MIKIINFSLPIFHFSLKSVTFASAFMFGEVLEWLKRHAWKACSRQNWLAGSNPVLSARVNRFKTP